MAFALAIKLSLYQPTSFLLHAREGGCPKEVVNPRRRSHRLLAGQICDPLGRGGHSGACLPARFVSLWRYNTERVAHIEETHAGAACEEQQPGRNAHAGEGYGGLS